MKKTKRIILSIFTAFLVLGCSNDTDDNNEKAKKTYLPGDSIFIDGIDYTVVENTMTALNDRSVASNLINTEIVSVNRGLEYLHNYFDTCIIALRKTGKFSVSKDYKTDENYMAVYNAVVPKKIPAGYAEKDFFEWTDSDNKSFYYRDRYIVLDKDLNQIGQLQIMWSSHATRYLKKSKNQILFSEVIKNMDILTLRSNIPEEYKISSTEKGLLTDIYSTSEGIIYSQQEIIDDFRYIYNGYSGKYPKIAASIWKNYDKTTGEWTGSTLCLHGTYREAASTRMLCMSVSKELVYSVTSVGSGVIEFDSDNHYKCENIEVTDITYKWNSKCTKYDDSGLPYCADIRSVPIEFVLLEDGSIDFGESVYDWAKRWRNFVVENNETASYLK